MREGRWTEAVADAARGRWPSPGAPVDLSQSRVCARTPRAISTRRAEMLHEAHRARRRRQISASARRSGCSRSARAEVDEANASFTSARALLGKRLPSPAWFHYASLAAGLAGRSRSRARADHRGREGAPASRGARQHPRGRARAARRFRGRGAGGRIGAGQRRARFHSCTRISATTSIARSGTRRRSTSISARSRSTRATATTSISSSATFASSGRRRSRRSRTGSAPSRHINPSEDEILRTNLKLARTKAS